VFAIYQVGGPRMRLRCTSIIAETPWSVGFGISGKQGWTITGHVAAKKKEMLVTPNACLDNVEIFVDYPMIGRFNLLTKA
jgi:hypothetical protein